MALRGDVAGLDKLAKRLESIGRPGSAAFNAIVSEAIEAVKALTRSQFAFGVGPDGRPQVARRRDGRPGLQSEKLSRGALGFRRTANGISAVAKNAKLEPILEGHQEGHVFPPRRGRVTQLRKAAKRGSDVTFGRIVSRRAFNRAVKGAESAARMAGEWGTRAYRKTTARGVEKFVAQRSTTYGVSFGRRVLPRRPIYPIGSGLTPRWERRIGEGIERALRPFLTRL